MGPSINKKYKTVVPNIQFLNMWLKLWIFACCIMLHSMMFYLILLYYTKLFFKFEILFQHYWNTQIITFFLIFTYTLNVFAITSSIKLNASGLCIPIYVRQHMFTCKNACTFASSLALKVCCCMAINCNHLYSLDIKILSMISNGDTKTYAKGKWKRHREATGFEPLPCI